VSGLSPKGVIVARTSARWAGQEKGGSVLRGEQRDFVVKLKVGTFDYRCSLSRGATRFCGVRARGARSRITFRRFSSIVGNVC